MAPCRTSGGLYVTEDYASRLRAGSWDSIDDRSPRSSIMGCYSEGVTMKLFRLQRGAHPADWKKKVEEGAREWMEATQLQAEHGLQCFQRLIGLCPGQEFPAPSPVPCIVMEFIGSNIMDHLQANPALTEAQRCLHLHDVARAMFHLHRHNITHGNLKGSNILVNRSGKVVLTDIGINAALYTLGGVDYSLRWKAPERVLEFPAPTKESDIWSFAITALEVLTGQLPFFGLSDAQIVIAMQQGQAIPPQPFGINVTLWQTLLLCWNYEPTARLSMGQVRAFIRNLVETGSLSNS